MIYVWANYESDDGRTWLVKVSPVNAADPARGWTVPDDPDTPQLPRGWLTRKVFGYTTDGLRRTAAVSTVASPLFTGEAPTFTVEGIDGTQRVVTVTGTLRERVLVVR